MSNSLKAYIFLLITTLGWGGNAVVGKLSVGHIGPFTLSAARRMLALGLILTISLAQIRRDWPEIRKHWLLMLCYGAAGFAGFNALLYTALKYTSAINSVIEQAGIPGVIFIGNFLLFRISARPAQILGFTLALVAVVLYAGYSVALRWKPAVHWKTLMAFSAVGAALACLPLLASEIAAGHYITPNAIGWAAILYTGTVPSLLSQVPYVRGVELIGSNRAGLFIDAIPIFGILLSVLFLGEPLHLFHLVAVAMVMAGIMIAEWGRR